MLPNRLKLNKTVYCRSGLLDRYCISFRKIRVYHYFPWSSNAGIIRKSIKLMHGIIRIADIVRIVGIIRGRVLLEEIRYAFVKLQFWSFNFGHTKKAMISKVHSSLKQCCARSSFVSIWVTAAVVSWGTFCKNALFWLKHCFKNEWTLSTLLSPQSNNYNRC